MAQPNDLSLAELRRLLQNMGSGGPFLPLAGGTLTGDLTLNAARLLLTSTAAASGDGLVRTASGILLLTIAGSEIAQISASGLRLGGAGLTLAKFLAPTVQKFTSGSGTYTLPTNPSPIYILIRMVGGGGGGAGGSNNSSADGANGSAGGDSTFGGLTAGKGNPGLGGTTRTGGLGGTNAGSPNLVSVKGGDGSPGQVCGNAIVEFGGGPGGASALGGNGRGGGVEGAASGAGATNSGGGGGGGAGASAGVNGSDGGAGGGAGGYLENLITSPSASYAYAVGGGGAGGAAGTGSGAGAGSAGGSGYIEVTEYYQ